MRPILKKLGQVGEIQVYDKITRLRKLSNRGLFSKTSFEIQVHDKINRLRNLRSHRGLFSKTRSGWRNTVYDKAYTTVHIQQFIHQFTFTSHRIYVDCSNYQDYQDYQDPSVGSTVTDGHRQGKKA